MDDKSKIREIDVWIDDFTPCLKDNLTGEVVNTEVIKEIVAYDTTTH